ncbi:MAG: hypothetical protein SFU56_01820 [Capsulimonadales bacterium]|nr:hypothetical protein [Capsulimonadales bacterium]
MAEVYSTPAPARGGDVILIDSPYRIHWGRTLIYGIGASLGLLLTHFLIYFGYGMNATNGLNLPLILGAFITDDPVGAQLLGIAGVVGLYTGAALAYAFVLHLFHFQSNHGKGTLYGFLLFVAMYAFLYPWMVGLASRWGLPQVTSSFLPNPDVMMNQAGHGNLGWEAVFLASVPHLVYGLILGSSYRHTELPVGERYRLRYLGD